MLAACKFMMSIVFSAANHSFRNNAEFHTFPFHPVLGFIIAAVAKKDIPKGSEVRDYDV